MTDPTHEFAPIASLLELEASVEMIRKRHPKCLLLFRGQTNLYPSVRSGRSRPEYVVHPAEEAGWVALVSLLVESRGGRAPHPRLTGAVLQHYGLATHYIDLTSDPQVAAWFACNRYREQRALYAGSALRMHRVAHYERLVDGEGYVLVLVVSETDQKKHALHLFDLGELPTFERPKRQRGWLMYDRPPILSDPNSFCRYVLRVDRRVFVDAQLTQQKLFPHPDEDPGHASLLSAPYVQIPSMMVRDYMSDSAAEKSGSADDLPMQSMCFATRLVDVPEYSSGADAPLVNHKWMDHTLYEPHHMRAWYRWAFEIETVHPGVTGNINKTKKISITPEARVLIREHAQSASSRWLELGADGLFFTFAEWDHDKVIDHGPPYHGVWVQRQGDLLVEVPMVADDDALAVHAGHVYLLWNGALIRQEVANSCRCGEPESHDDRIGDLMAVPDLLDRGLLRLVPHPFNLPNWFILW